MSRTATDSTVLLGHGSGGQMMKRIIDEVFLDAFGSPELLEGNDAGVAALPASSSGDPKASKKTSSIMRFIIWPPEPWPSRTVLSVTLWDISKTPIVVRLVRGGVRARFGI